MKLSNSILKSIFTVSIFSIILMAIIFIVFLYTNFENEKGNLKEQYIQTKKSLLKKEIQKVYDYVEYHENISNLKLREKLENRVTQAYHIAQKIYNENKDIKSDKQIKQLIVDALKNISYENDRQYFFINTNDGKAVLFNKQSFLNQNKNVWNLRDVKGQYIIRRQSNIALSKGSGFVKNYFIKPDLEGNKEFPKLSFIKNFKAFNWHIGMGEYLDDALKKNKAEILDYISSIRFDKNGYIFVNSTNKKALVFDGAKLTPPKDYPNDLLFKKQIEASKNKDGDFFFYKFKKLNSQKEFPKMGYVKLYENWGWLIGTGIYIDEVDRNVQFKANDLKDTMLSQIYLIALFVLAALILTFFVSQKISNIVYSNIDFLIKSFNLASKELKLIDKSKLSYAEFKSLAENLNKILIARNEFENRLKDYFKLVNNYVITSSTNKDGMITEVSDAFCEISGYSKDELIGRSHNIIKHEDMPKETYQDLWDTILEGKIWKGEIKNKKKNGDSYWVDVIIEPVLKDGEITGFTAIRQDITSKKQVEYLSITDELTGLYNRRYFNQKIEEEINRTRREKNFLSMIILDIDYFKKYNDTYGHQAGDKALKELSDLLSSMANRSSDFVFRLGGEEFALIISHKHKDDAFNYANKIRQAVEELHIEHKASEVSQHLTISVGVVTKDASEINSSNEIYKLADEALYEAKENGRNKVCIN